MIISISGIPGSGKSTLADRLSKKLEFKRYYMGQIMRDMAKKHGMTLEEYGEVCKTDSEFDKETDEYQKKLGENEEDFVIEGRTSYYFIARSVKIFLSVDLLEAARRIINASLSEKESRNEKETESVDEKISEIKNRIECERERYKKYYDIED